MKKAALIILGLLLSLNVGATTLPDNVMLTVLEYGSVAEINFLDEFSDGDEKIYEVRLTKKKHEIILLINEHGSLVEKIKDKHFPEYP